MRITIQIDGDQTAASSVQIGASGMSGASNAGAPQTMAAAPSAAGTGMMGPPPEVLAAAAAVGAQDAGPAPAGLRAMGTMGAMGEMGAMQEVPQEMPQAMGAPIPFTRPTGAVAGPSDQSAGAAPGSSIEAPPQVIAEEGSRSQ